MKLSLHTSSFMVSFNPVITAPNAHPSVSYRSINATRLVDNSHSMTKAVASRKPAMAKVTKISGNVVDVDVDVVTGGED